MAEGDPSSLLGLQMQIRHFRQLLRCERERVVGMVLPDMIRQDSGLAGLEEELMRDVFLVSCANVVHCHRSDFDAEMEAQLLQCAQKWAEGRGLRLPWTSHAQLRRRARRRRRGQARLRRADPSSADEPAASSMEEPLRVSMEELACFEHLRG